MLGRRRVGARDADRPGRLLRQRGPDLLAGQLPAPVRPHRARRQPGQVRARARLAEQLAPQEVTAQRRRQEPLLLLRAVPYWISAGHHPGADGQAGNPDPGRPQFLVDDHLLERARVPSPRAGQVRHDPAPVRQPPRALGAGQPGDRRELLADLRPELGVAPRQLHLDRPADPGQGQPGHALRPFVRRAEQGAQGHRPPVVQVGLVLPGVADPAEHLDVLVRAPDRGVQRHHRGHPGGELALAAGGLARARLRGIGRAPAAAVSGSVRAASQTAAAACSATVSIRAQRCFTAWNWPIGRPN